MLQNVHLESPAEARSQREHSREVKPRKYPKEFADDVIAAAEKDKSLQQPHPQFPDNKNYIQFKVIDVSDLERDDQARSTEFELRAELTAENETDAKFITGLMDQVCPPTDTEAASAEEGGPKRGKDKKNKNPRKPKAEITKPIEGQVINTD
eukprot:13838457-Alexandrium_andersonii.AAC.1